MLTEVTDTRKCVTGSGLAIADFVWWAVAAVGRRVAVVVTKATSVDALLAKRAFLRATTGGRAGSGDGGVVGCA